MSSTVTNFDRVLKENYCTKCDNCYIANSEVPLKICSGCKTARYCSRQCQSAHWRTHKEFCNKNTAHMDALKSPANPLNLIPLPDGMTLTKLDQRLAKWIRFHRSTLMVASIHALSLPKDISRTRTHLVHIILTTRTDHGGLPSKYFRVGVVTVRSISEAREFGPPWPESLEDLAKLREESESKKRGTVAAIAIECPPLHVQMVPFGSLRDLFRVRILPNWEEILKRDVENGAKFVEFGRPPI